MANKKLNGRGEKIREKIERVVGVIANAGVVVSLIYVFSIM